MAAGDPQRVWFPEMLETLKEQWNIDMTWEQVSFLCDEMKKMRDYIRETRNIKPVRLNCKECGEYSLSTPGKISIRSLLFALKKVSKITDEQLKELDKDWKKCRKLNNLDAYGKKAIVSNLKKDLAPSVKIKKTNIF